MTWDDDLEVYLNAFEKTATAARWPEAQCLIGLARQAIDATPHGHCDRL